MRQKIALVLSGGGARGNAHIGIIEELVRQGFEIASVTGTSMGALVGGIYADGELAAFKEWMVSLDRRRVFNLVDFTFNRSGMVKGDRVFTAMMEFIHDAQIEDLPIPYAAVAVDLIGQREVVFRHGSLFDAIRASVSIPTVLTPVEAGDCLFVDGSVLNNIPVDHAPRVEGDLLVVADVNAKIPVMQPDISTDQDKEQRLNHRAKVEGFQAQLRSILHPGQALLESSGHEDQLLGQGGTVGYFHLMNTVFNLMTDHMARMNLANHQPDILIEVSRDACGTFDFFKAQELIEMGRYATQQSLDGGARSGRTD